MAFLCSLDTKAMSEFVIRRFSWDQRGKAFPPSSLPKDFRSLCPDFDLAVAELAVEHYELPELPQAIFYAMLLNEAEKLSVLQGLRLRSLEVVLTELRWGVFESWIWLFSDRIYEAQFCLKSGSSEGARGGRQRESSSEGVAADDAAPEELSLIVCTVSMAFPPIRSMREMANYGDLHLALDSRPPRLLPEDFNMLCPCFSLAEAAAAELELPEIVQATFYAMLLNEMFELGVVHEYTAERMKSLLVGLRWLTFKVWMRIMDEVIRRAQFHHQPDEMDVKGARDGQGEGSGSADPPAPSSDEE
ncbi:LOW QUALITY PROTEIN: hypothetical protein Cgig2_013883 [Carnegiea gigantea]|uniref:Uncharacterized protein n=1 Tax=Carnegiea gigantea TaxID=171969 RepID=A0A9Q1JHH5_9CARY|nr:LOW QUALITY PROTEIN: hypothetical protein Cgig2_013883 [Carnegiea gigantea]